MNRYRSLTYRHVTLATAMLVSWAVAATAIAADEHGAVVLAGVGRAAGPQCPQMIWHIGRVGGPNSHDLAGAIWFDDMSGVSTAKGAMSPSGQLSLALTSVQGAGPTGAVTGHHDADGSVIVDLNGPGCSKLKVRIMPTTHHPLGGG